MSDLWANWGSSRTGFFCGHFLVFDLWTVGYFHFCVELPEFILPKPYKRTISISGADQQSSPVWTPSNNNHSNLKYNSWYSQYIVFIKNNDLLKYWLLKEWNAIDFPNKSCIYWIKELNRVHITWTYEELIKVSLCIFWSYQSMLAVSHRVKRLTC